MVRDLCARHRVDMAAFCADLCMGWDELATLAADPLVTIGAHTVNHPILTKLDDKAVRAELGSSRDVIEAALGVRPAHLAYPVGDRTAAGPREFQIAADLGFKTAVTTRPGVVFREHAEHLTALPRISLNGNFQRRAMPRCCFGRRHRIVERLSPAQRDLTDPVSIHRHQRHRRQHPADAGDDVIDRRDPGVVENRRELRDRHGDQRPDDHQREQREGADQLADANGHGAGFAGAH